MFDTNQVVLCGILDRQADVAFKGNGKASGFFFIRIQEKYKNETKIHKIKVGVFGQNAEDIASCEPGSRIVVIGAMQSYEGVSKEGNSYLSNSVYGREVHIVGNINSNGEPPRSNNDIPF